MIETVFITATGTEVGKTYVACALIRTLIRRGLRIEAFKPVLSGFTDPETSDAGRLLRAMGRSLIDLNKMSPYRFKAPLAPPSAARLEGVGLTLRHLEDLCRERMVGPLLIEGAGGVMSPIAEDGTNLDLIAALGAPALLVTGSYLGAVSHTLTAIEAMRARDVKIAAVVISESEAAGPALAEIEEALSRYAPKIPHFTAPRAENFDAARLSEPLYPRR